MYESEVQVTEVSVGKLSMNVPLASRLALQFIRMLYTDYTHPPPPPPPPTHTLFDGIIIIIIKQNL